MENIRTRISPHFFFNALSTLSAETADPETTHRNIKMLLLLLRKSVDNAEQLAIPLADELELVKGYISLQGGRVPEPFTVNYDVVPGTNLDHLIPAMIIQIPVENAIKHGLMPVTGEKTLTIRLRNYDTGVLIIVEDNGTGYLSSANRIVGAGTGLKLLHQTINTLNSINSSKIEFSIRKKETENRTSRGTIVEIKVPDNYSYDLATKK